MSLMKIKTPELMWEYFSEYYTKIKGNPFLVKDWVGKDGREVNREKERPLTMLGFENYLANEGIMADCSDYFESDGPGYVPFKEVCKRIKKTILQDHMEGAMASMYHSGVTSRLNGWTEKSENINNNINRNITINVVDSVTPISHSEKDVNLE